MSSLQALLDAQERRGGLPSGGSSERGGGGGGRSSGDRRRGGADRRSSSSTAACDRGGDHSRRRPSGGGGWSRPSPRPPPTSRTNGDRDDDAAGGGTAASGSRWRSWDADKSARRPPGWDAHRSSAPARGSEEGGGTYEERRARIERRAIEESRRRTAAADRRDGDDDDDDDDDDEDVRSLSSWVGPLVVIDGVDGRDATKRCTYYQDRDKRYPFHTDERGFGLLTRLMETNFELLRINRGMIEEGAAKMTTSAVGDESNRDGDGRDNTVGCDCYDAKDVIVRIGQGLYAHKPTLRTRGVTWSTEEYSHPGLQRMYLRMKSIQRFTEIWSLLERSEAMGAFDEIFVEGKCGPVLRIAAIGGGPGYELLATKLFFEERAPPGGGPRLELTCMDICPAWRRYVEALGFSFVEYDIDNEGGTDPLRAMGLEDGELHFCIVSCVMIYVTNDRVMKMFHRLVHDSQVRAILVSERGERTSACTMMEGLGGKVIRLIDQSDGMDERQAIWASHKFCDEQLRSGRPDYEAHQGGCVFPNVPYCEHKERRRFAGR
ncbi:hypothetical protein ACHAW5_006887 [Stephanodiscus triporus]|uniref:Uncharacterized protein n=1 Tax=Stephanodiscus triporus TaxID=2934178 RepID=A0ABD3MUV3_9STRA